MASNASHPLLWTSSRGRAFWLPREHGAWGLLFVPLVTGAAAGNPRGERIIWTVLFAAAALGLFCLRTPAEAWLGISTVHPQSDAERKLIHHFIFIYSSVAGLALAVLIPWARAYDLLLIGAAAALAFLLQIALQNLARQARGRTELRTAAQLLGAVALSSTAAAAFYLATGRFGRLAGILWLVNALFAANQIHYVQLRIHSARASALPERFGLGRGFLFHQAATLLLLALIWRAGWLPGLILVAFIPLYFRGVWWYFAASHPLKVHRLGLSELSYAIVFGTFCILGYVI